MTTGGHIPVLFKETLSILAPSQNQNFIDFTLGGGGHAEAILKKTSPHGKLYAFDRDLLTLSETKKKLKKFENRLVFFHARMSQVEDNIENFEGVNGVLMDLGVSSFQLDEKERGFSFQNSGPLDMRMDTTQGRTLKEELKQLNEKELADIIYQYGEERLSRRIARSICLALESGNLESTKDLAELVKRCYPFGGKKSKIHPATKTFQALRIYLNSELEELSQILKVLKKKLKPKSKIAIITFHSLEDRMVKHCFREWAQEGFGRLIQKKPICPSETEVELNPRARSAKLRGFEVGCA